MLKKVPKGEWSDYSAPPMTITVVEQERYETVLYTAQGDMLVTEKPSIGFNPKRKLE